MRKANLKHIATDTNTIVPHEFNLGSVKLDQDWAFQDVKRSESRYASHGYHRYPAKFIPQLVRKLLEKYSVPGDVVLDPFGGCGTTLVESRLNARHAISVDINKVAVLISKAKKEAIDPTLLKQKNTELIRKLDAINITKDYYSDAHPRLAYWFKRPEFNLLTCIYALIRQECNSRVRTFYLCCFSNILKNCSIWLAKSIKPTRDLHKKVENPVVAFKRHLAFMTARNKEFYELMDQVSYSKNTCQILTGDARRLQLPANKVDLIITSPPYATSYEYADLHQLSTLWFGYATDLHKMKKGFIGTSTRRKKKYLCDSVVLQGLIPELEKKSKKLARHVNNYYADLIKCYKEMYRVLKPNRYLCLILGDTEYMGVKIPNIAFSVETLEHLGFTIDRVIKRKLSSKIFTPYRDKNGKFADASHTNKHSIYQYEYIISARKDSKSNCTEAHI